MSGPQLGKVGIDGVERVISELVGGKGLNTEPNASSSPPMTRWWQAACGPARRGIGERF